VQLEAETVEQRPPPPHDCRQHGFALKEDSSAFSKFRLQSPRVCVAPDLLSFTYSCAGFGGQNRLIKLGVFDGEEEKWSDGMPVCFSASAITACADVAIISGPDLPVELCQFGFTVDGSQAIIVGGSNAYGTPLANSVVPFSALGSDVVSPLANRQRQCAVLRQCLRVRPGM